MAQTALVCDDAVFIRTMLADILRRAGFTIVGEAGTGELAVQKYHEFHPDLVTMDIVLPDMSGIDAVRAITTCNPDARIVVCSAMGQQALVVDSMQAGARDFVVKPFHQSRILEAVRHVLA